VSVSAAAPVSAPIQAPVQVPPPPPAAPVTQTVQTRSPPLKQNKSTKDNASKVEAGAMVQNVFRGAFAGLLDRCANGSVPASSQEFQDAQDAKASAAQAAEEVMQELSSQQPSDGAVSGASASAPASVPVDVSSRQQDTAGVQISVSAEPKKRVSTIAEERTSQDGSEAVHIWSEAVSAAPVSDQAQPPVHDWNTVAMSSNAVNPQPVSVHEHHEQILSGLLQSSAQQQSADPVQTQVGGYPQPSPHQSHLHQWNSAQPRNDSDHHEMI